MCILNLQEAPVDLAHIKKKKGGGGSYATIEVILTKVEPKKVAFSRLTATSKP